MNDVNAKAVRLEGTASMTGSVRIEMRSYFSTHHLYAARYAAEDARAREDRIATSGGRFDIRHRAHVLNAITSSVAFMEAVINEAFLDAIDGHQSYIKSLGASCVADLAKGWSANGQDRMKMFDKYDLFLECAGKGPLRRGELPCQDAQRVVRLRNHLTHYKPENVSADTPHRFEKSMKGRFAENKLMAGSGNPWFPDKALGAGCAEWAWKASLEFVDDFAKCVNVQLNYQQVNFADPLPA